MYLRPQIYCFCKGQVGDQWEEGKSDDPFSKVQDPPEDIQFVKLILQA